MLSRRPPAISVRAAVAAVGLIASGATASPSLAAALSCQAERAGQRAFVEVRVKELFDRELLRLVELGLVGRLRVDLALYRRRRFWFDARVGESSQVLAIAWSEEQRRFTLDGHDIPRATDLALPPLAVQPEAGAFEPGDAYVDVRLRLEVITPSSLGRVASWLMAPKVEPGEASQTDEGAPAATTAGASGGPPPGGLVPGALINYLAADLARTARGRCGVVP